MAEKPSAPEIHIATPTTGNDGKVEFTIVPSKTKMHEFKPEEIALIDARLQTLATATGADTLKRMGDKQAIVAKNTPELIKSLHQARGDNGLLSQEEVDKTITAEHFEKAEAGETLIPPPIPEAEKPEDVVAQATEFIKNPPKKSSDFYKMVSKLPVIGPLITAIIDSMRGGYSFEAEENFEAQVVPMLSALGIELPTNPAAKKALGKSTMEKLGTIGIPLENTQAFFKFITDPTIDIKTIPQNLRDKFESGRKNYEDIRGSLNPDPLLAMGQILGFTVEKTNTEPEAPTAPTGPTTPEAPKVETEITLGELKLTGKPEDITAYKELRDTATKILGKDFDEKTLATIPKIKDAKPEDQLRAASTNVFVRVVDKLKTAYGNDFGSKIEGADTTTKNILTNYMDGATSLDLKTIVTMGEMLSPKNLEKIFWVGVKTLEEKVGNWKESKKDKPEPYKGNCVKIADNFITTITGHGARTGEGKTGDLNTEAQKSGYAGMIAKNITQIGNFDNLVPVIDKEDGAQATAKLIDMGKSLL